MTNQHQHPSLRDLINKAADERALAGRALAELAQKHGFEITHGTVNSIRSGSYKSRPSDGTLRAIAWLAGVSDEVAFEAAGRKMPGRPFAEDLPPGVDELEPRQRKAAVEMLKAMVALQQEVLELRDDKATDPDRFSPPLSLVPDPADTLAAMKGRSQADIENEEADRWDGIDPPGPDDGV
ncbi:hypothetical protein ACRAJ3_09920 [Rhodococcus pyridinivorans]|uniref:hypothetical protein n=1 Tax=Rhodococcus pyridinivorans TaxID=103816 RepID=UPI003D7FC414